MGRSLVLGALACATAVAGCETSAPAPVLLDTEPKAAFNDQETRLRLAGTGFWPSYDLDVAAGRSQPTARGYSGRVGRGDVWVPLREFAWLSPEALEATLPKQLPTGTWDIELEDPRGGRTVLLGRFNSSGPDREPPVLSFERPTELTPAAPGSTLDVRLLAFDANPGRLKSLEWQCDVNGRVVGAGVCVPWPGGATTCAFQVKVPESTKKDDRLRLLAFAADWSASGNPIAKDVVIELQSRPTIVQVFPRVGSTSGGTDFVLRGADIPEGSRVLLGTTPLAPEGGIRLDSTTISGRAPPHPPGLVDVVLETPVGKITLAQTFFYQLPPTLASITPAAGAGEGGTDVVILGSNFDQNTRILFGHTPGASAELAEPRVISTGQIVGRTPPGVGTVSVWAIDPYLGATSLPNAFTFLPRATDRTTRGQP